MEKLKRKSSREKEVKNELSEKELRTSVLRSVLEPLRKAPEKSLLLLKSLPLEEKQALLYLLNERGKLEFAQLVERGGDSSNGERFNSPKVYESADIVNLGFDTEDNGNGLPHLFIFSDGSTTYEFREKEDTILWLYCSQFGKPVIVWAVNAEYDINNLFWGYDYLIHRILNKGRFIMGRLETYGIRGILPIKFYDVGNFYSGGVAVIGSMFGKKKLDFEFKPNRRKDKTGKIIPSKKEITYCERDTEIARIAGEHLVDMISGYGVAVPPTIASASLQVYLRKYDKIGFTKPNPNNIILTSEEKALLRASYFGGRCEAFHIGQLTGNMHYYDVNSLYPYVMKEYNYPNPYSRVRIGKSANIGNGVVWAKVKVPKMHICPLPIKRGDNRLIFPYGSFSGVWTIAELNNALNYGVKILKVYKSIEYQTVTDLFTEFVNEFYGLRLQATTAPEKTFYKLVLNSLYGKFGQYVRNVHYVAAEEITDPFAQIVNDKVAIEEEYPALHTNIIIPSYVTAYGRILLYNYLRSIEEKGGDLLYCDTDSFIYKGEFEYPTGKELGELKEEAQIVYMEINGAKYYMYEESSGDRVYVCKGVPKAQQADFFLNKRATFRKPLKYREALRRKKIPNTWIDIEKESLTDYTKRAIVKGSTKTEPIEAVDSQTYFKEVSRNG